MADIKRVVTGKVRLSHVHVFKPNAAVPGATEKYSVVVLLPKSDVATKARIDAAIKAATDEGVQKVWNGMRPPKVSTPIHDGDGTRPSDGMPYPEECKGCWVFTASTGVDYGAPELADGVPLGGSKPSAADDFADDYVDDTEIDPITGMPIQK